MLVFQKNCRRFKIDNALLDLVPFVQFFKTEKRQGGVLVLVIKVTLLHGCLLRFLNCTNTTKSRKASHMVNPQSQVITIDFYLLDQQKLICYMIAFHQEHFRK